MRSSGIIMHISSLPSKYGIGTFGKEAYEFADFLSAAGQKYWQILPLGHTSYGDSPYQSFSAFAGNPYFIDLDTLAEEGLLKLEDYNQLDFGNNPEQVDYEKMFNNRYKVLEIAFNNAKNICFNEIIAFAFQEGQWLHDYALFMSVKERMGMVGWQEWPEDIKLRWNNAICYYEHELEDRILFWKFIQYEFFKQWNKLKSYVNSLEIEIIGDIPIYVASDSCDTWANPEIFKLDSSRNPTVVAGCPPDAFSKTGQLWGNPIYNWEYLEYTGYGWWINRIKESLKLYNVIRIDHFRGFEAFWEIPFGNKTAAGGKWVKGPAIKLFDVIKNALGDNLNIIAEDLGYLTQSVIDFRNATKFPGMKVLQFAFDTREESEYIPHTYDKNCVVYTGTHDNDTIRGWMETTGETKDIQHAINYLKLTANEGYTWGFIRGAWSSVGDIAITQMQDLLNLGNTARMNYPSTLGGNWSWRMNQFELTEELTQKLHNITILYGRCINPEIEEIEETEEIEEVKEV
ncbi:4-alpha-glucanotransferase [Candidatus Epulonipiscium fishelsonii]|uniref:4-alpha-glucanotransferase n=1 Tax=Candidatus Epulonipiscium fishelsonii TaxID=77094 RepID=A0ACC8X6S4_9FIRM|nr:4-alpha-glucanotransferase [Epulopiscium sp. SCG-B11WGA-EpuloA1]ONI38328.1 4-alpha-glucanotransferase [Epulopiscium sp. SCG-B05WGA-EpuloA1]